MLTGNKPFSFVALPASLNCTLEKLVRSPLIAADDSNGCFDDWQSIAKSCVDADAWKAK